MGDRVSVSFINRNPDRFGAQKVEPVESITIFSHWGGRQFPELAQKYANQLAARESSGVSQPLDRREPDTVMLDFIRWLFAKGHLPIDSPIESNYYLGKDESDGDNSDNGHFAIDITASD